MDSYRREKNYWKDEIQNLKNSENFTWDYYDKSSYESGIYVHTFDKKQVIKLNEICKNNKLLIYTFLVAALKITLSKYTMKKNLAIGIPCYSAEDNDKLITNRLLPLTSYIDYESSYLKYMNSIKSKILECYKNQIYLDRKIFLENNLTNDIREIVPIDICMRGLHKEKYIESIHGSSKNDLSFLLELTEENLLNVDVVYNANKISEYTIEVLCKSYEEVLKDVLSDHDKKIKDIKIISEKDINKILLEFNNTKENYPEDKTIQELFEEQVEKTPDNIAVEFEDKSLTYKELNEKANSLARTLIDNGLKEETIVPIIVERSLEMIVGIIAVLKSGGAYLPIDPEYPEYRIKHMLENSESKILLTNSNIAEKIGLEKKYIDLRESKLYLRDKSNLPVKNSSKSLAYVIYTSGSTGNPKGVMIEHRQVTNFITGILKKTGMNIYRNLLAITTMSFDIFVLETLVPLTSGMKVIIAKEKTDMLGEELAEIIKKNQVEVIQSTPSRVKLLMNNEIFKEALKNIKLILIGGEVFPKGLLKELNKYNNLKIYNMYGPTETTVWSCVKEIIKEQAITIGKPIQNTNILILDEHNNMQPIGAIGELCIGGNGVARGYLHESKLTKEKFIENPYSAGEVIYKTGDLARWLQNGEIDCLGRIDNQIKVRGFRIEVGEIENVLLKNESIREAIVTIKKDEKENALLVAYIVGGNELKSSELRVELAKYLPYYMIPSCFIKLKELPLTPNGKIDKKALDLVNIPIDTGVKYVEAKNDVQKKLVSIYKRILDIESIGINDNFFDLGGNSLKIIKLKEMIDKEFRKQVDIMDLFRYTTINELSKYLSKDEVMNNRTDTEKYDNSEKNSNNIVRTGMEIAVIGMAGRFPKANNIKEFWSNIIEGKECISFFTQEELKEMGIDEKIIKDPNYVKAKGVLDNIDYFDHEFFGYTPRQAMLMDPQLRVLHENIWAALEDAGYNPDEYKGEIGMFLGAAPNLMWVNGTLMETGSPSDQADIYALNDSNFFATRISYKLNLHGPSYTLQTACSSSLVSIHEACKSLITRDCDMALAGGVKISLPQKNGYFYEKGMIFSPDGHCRVFDKDSEGTLGGDGVGSIVLKRLDDALKDGDHIYSIIKGSAINNDGSRKVGFTAPSIDGQVEVIKKAQRIARINGEGIGYIEAHGTGTPLGDPIEVSSLNIAFNTEKRHCCAIGSVKANIGHLDAAAGVAGFIKTVLVLENKMIPPSINFENYNQSIDFDNTPFYVTKNSMEFKTLNQPRVAAVSSFGIGGTNAHIILQEALEDKKYSNEKYKVIVLSAKTELALEEMSARLIEFLKENQYVNLEDVAYTLQVGRKSFDYRKVVVCEDSQQAIELLQVENKRIGNTGFVDEDKKVAFVFSGQGSHYVNMGLGLYENEFVFRNEMDKCFEILEYLTGYNYKQEIYPTYKNEDEVKFQRIEHVHVLIFIVEYSLAKLLMYWGIKPDVMIGYSLGEYVVACLQEMYSLEDALKIIIARAKLIGEIENGAMLSVPLSEEKLKPLLSNTLSISIANDNSCVISGSKNDIDNFENEMKNNRCMCMKLNNLHIAHSKMLEPILNKFRIELEKIKINEPNDEYVSCITGEWVTKQEVRNVEYWVNHLRDTVHFEKGIKNILKDENYVFVEVGPGRDLGLIIRRSIQEEPNRKIVNTIRNSNQAISDVCHLYNQVGKLWLSGVEIDWRKIHPKDRKRVSLPTYPFEKNYFNTNRIANISLKHFSKESLDSLDVYKKLNKQKKDKTLKQFNSSNNYIEDTIIDMLEKMFGVDDITIEDDFFDLGGDSLKAITFVTEIHKKLNIQLNVTDIFNNPTIKQVSDYISKVNKSQFYEINKVEDREYYQVSAAQKRMFLLNQLDKSSIAYNIPTALTFEGNLEIDRLEKAFTKLIERHESLRTSFEIRENIIVQRIRDINEIDFNIDIEYIDEIYVDYKINQFIKPFDLKKAPLFRVKILKINKEKHVILTDIHHIISDGISIGVLTKELGQIYSGQKLKPLKTQYKDFAEWQNNVRQSSQFTQQKDYWINEFKGELPKLNMPTDYSRPMVKEYTGSNVKLKIDKELTKNLKKIIKETDTTMYMILLANLNILLSKYSGQQDIIVGSPVSGREHSDLQNIIGMFVNTVAIRSIVSPNLSYKDYLSLVKNKTLKAYDNQGYPFEELVENLKFTKDISRNPIFDVMFGFLNMEKTSLQMKNINIHSYEINENVEKFDITFRAQEVEEEIKIDISYSTSLFKKDTIEKLAQNYVEVLHQVVNNMNIKIENIGVSYGVSEIESFELEDDFLD